MKQNLYYPPNQLYNQQDGDSPLVFLAGPILGADDWQSQAVKSIHDKNPNIIIANPRRDKWETDEPAHEFEVQVVWETNHLRLASAYGGIMFWLAKETSHIC